MEKFREILKYVELFAWGITIVIVGIFAVSILRTLYFVGGTIDEGTSTIMLYIIAVFFMLPLSLKGARSALK